MKKLLIACLLFFAVLTASCGDDTIDFHGVQIPKSWPYRTVTPSGASVRSVVPIPSNVQAWIDEGLVCKVAAGAKDTTARWAVRASQALQSFLCRPQHGVSHG